jgi:transmembrane sensor
VLREALNAEKLAALDLQEAAAVFVARKAEGLTSSEQQLLDEWLARDVAHLHALESAVRAWQSFDNSDDDEILAAMRSHALAPRGKTRNRWLPAAAAAALVLIALTFVIGNSWKPRSPDVSNLQTSAQYASSSGEVTQLRLPDGSHMTLDADSGAIASFTANARKLDLQKGRALFAVHPNTTRPFSVSAAGRIILAVGTQFDVNIVPDGITVTLIEGRVDISSEGNGRALVTLGSGQQYIERGGNVTIRTIGAATGNVTAWQKGLINFDDQPLSEAAAVMNRYSREQIVIGARAAGIRVSGQFRAGDTQRFAATLAEMHGLELDRQGDRIDLAQNK